MLAATLYRGNHDRNHTLWDIGSAEIYIIYMQVLPKYCYISMDNSQCGNLNNLSCLQGSLLTGPHYKFRGVGQGMKQTYLYLWYPLFQDQDSRPS